MVKYIIKSKVLLVLIAVFLVSCSHKQSAKEIQEVKIKEELVKKQIEFVKKRKAINLHNGTQEYRNNMSFEEFKSKLNR